MGSSSEEETNIRTREAADPPSDAGPVGDPGGSGADPGSNTAESVRVTPAPAGYAGDERGPSPPLVTSRVNKFAGALLLLGALSIGTLGIGMLASPGVEVVGELTPSLAIIAGAYLLGASIVKATAGFLALAGRAWYTCYTATLLSATALITLPLDVLALGLLALGEGRFDRG